jgi:5-methylcytosine-specific restriction endonuclease McrA
MVCNKCGRNFKLIKTSKLDGFCGKCRSDLKHIKEIDKYRKTKYCPDCGKLILNVSKFCNSCSQLKDRNHSWKEDKLGRKLYSTREYKNWEKSVKIRDGKKCMLCGDTKRLAAHHILPKRDYPDRIFDINNGITLCHKHHSEIQFKEDKYINVFKSIIKAELKLCELGEGCDANTEPSQIILEGVTTRDEIKFPKSAGQPLQ